ncbi:hypothetical protein BDM02DRAFT_899673 [Thelephora ganbajun]|uniref:Uncharacterized protein n=1 Tax=Thelephora ganbajun TaxID=370292 RepID=A0ACB6ZNH4_THEGA|nr:hypothetical protein BDM02DRAFT_899673 [Thelephora ganbajun]
MENTKPGPPSLAKLIDLARTKVVGAKIPDEGALSRDKTLKSLDGKIAQIKDFWNPRVLITDIASCSADYAQTDGMEEANVAACRKQRACTRLSRGISGRNSEFDVLPLHSQWQTIIQCASR